MLRDSRNAVGSRHSAINITRKSKGQYAPRILGAAITAGLFLAGGHAASAASLIWDANTATAGAQDGSGTWDTTTANWYNGTADQVLGPTDSAVFGTNTSLASAFTVTLGANVTATNLTFNNSGANAYTIGTASGTNTLTLGGTGGTGPSIIASLANSGAINIINSQIINSGGLSFVGTSPTLTTNVQIPTADPSMTGSVVIGDGTNFMRVYAPTNASLSAASSVTVKPYATLELTGTGNYNLPSLTLTNSGPSSAGGTGMGGRGEILFALNGENITSNISLSSSVAGGFTRLLGINYQTISGNIGESGASSGVEYEENTAGTYLTLLKGTNTYTGPTIVNVTNVASVNNILSASSDANFGADPTAPTTSIVFTDAVAGSATYLRADASFTLNANRNIDLTGHVGTTPVTFGSSTNSSSVATGVVASYTQTFDTNGHNLTIGGQIIGNTADATIAETVAKNGAGTLTFAQDSAYAGPTVINAGTLLSTANSTAGGLGVAGTGALTLTGGTLSIAPTGTGANVSLTGVSASTTTSTLRFGPGSTLALNKGGNNSLTLTLGASGTNGLTVISRNGTLGNTLIIAPASGTASLGTSTGETLLVNGAAPILVNGIQRAAVFGQDNDTNQSGDFITYDSTMTDPAIGFIRSPYSTSADINGGGSAFGSTRIFNASSSTNSVLTAGTSVYALRDNGQTISGAFTLQIGVNDSSGNIYSSVIMNGGAITTSTLAFGVTPAAIYTSAANASISSMITETKGIALTGPGTLTLSGTSTYTGGTFINNTALSISALGNIGGSGSGAVTFTGGTLDTTANMTISNLITLNPWGQNLVGGAIDVGSGLTTTLSGVISGAGNLTKLDSGTLVLTGTNTYTGQVIINGGIVSVATVANSGTSSNLGAGIVPFALATLNGGTLQFTGSTGGTTNRFISLGTNGGTLDASGTVAFKIAGPLLDYNTQTGSRTLTLTGTSNISLQNTFGNTIGDNGGSTSLVKAGSNEWLLSAPSTYTGSTSVLGGTLGLASGGSFPGGTALIVDSANAGTLDLSGFGLSVSSLNNGPNGGGTITDSVAASTATLTASSGTFGGVIKNGAGTVSLTEQGLGTLVLGGANTYTGITHVTGGTLTLASTGSIASTVVTVDSSAIANINGLLTAAPAVTANGTVNIGSSDIHNDPASGILTRTWGSLTIGATASVAFAPATSTATRDLLVTTLTNTAGGKLDLSSNELILHSANMGSVSTAGSISNQIAAGFNGGAWNGTTGITSSAAANDSTYLTAIGYAQGGSTFDGVGTSTTDLLVKYTYYGDTNLDGAVDGSDYTNIDNGFANALTGWQNGDFNYDGVVDGSDYTLIDNAFNTQGASLGSNPAALIASATAQISGGSSVPEPTSLALLGIGAGGLLSRRRRRC